MNEPDNPPQRRGRKGSASKMQILSLTEGAIRAVVYLARARPDQKVPGEELCRTQEISAPFLIKITRSLTRHGLVSATRGAGGGFELARPAASISLLEVIEAVQGPFLYNQCLLGPNACHRESECPVHPVWKQIRENTENILSSWTLADLAWVSHERQRRQARISRTGEET